MRDRSAIAVWVLAPALMLFAGCGAATQMSGSGSGGGLAGPGGGLGGGSTALVCPMIQTAEAGPQPFPSAPPLPPPAPGPSSFGSVCILSPANGVSVTSPLTMTAVADLVPGPIGYQRVYIDGNADYFTFYNQFTGLFWMPSGSHTLEVLATDAKGNNVSSSLNVKVAGTAASPTITNIQNMQGWEPCSQFYPPGSPRAGQLCAAGEGDATSTMTQGVSTPSLSGSSAHFTLGGSTGNSNELYTMNLGGGDSPTKFTYDFYVMVDNPRVPQALEFDVNQTVNDTRWTWGTACNFNGNYPYVGEWDVWNGAPNTGWQKTSAPCPLFQANQWVHIVWQFERVGQQVHYISLQVDNNSYPLNLYYSAQPNWSMGQINVAFQMDGNSKQDPYNVWLDKVNLTVQ